MPPAVGKSAALKHGAAASGALTPGAWCAKLNPREKRALAHRRKPKVYPRFLPSGHSQNKEKYSTTSTNQTWGVLSELYLHTSFVPSLP